MKHAKIILVLAVLIMAAGCGPAQREVVEVHVGTDGLAINFLEGSPPSEVFMESIFPVTFDIKNLGAVDISPSNTGWGVLGIGVEKQFVEVRTEEYKDQLAKFELRGRSVYDPVGGFDRKTISLRAKKLDPQAETLTTVVALTACYPYKTEATAQVCVDTDVFGQRDIEKVCSPGTISMGSRDVNGQSLPSGQGAPIAITKIEQKMLPHPDEEGKVIPSYMIYVRNMGNGLPVNIQNFEDACKGSTDSELELNVITANVYLSDRTLQLDCKPKREGATEKTGFLRLEKNEDYIRCTLDEGISTARGTFTTPLMIELDYGYTFTVSKNVLIRRQV